MFSLFSKHSKPAAPVDWIIAGLGNPGSQYDNTRHNTGFMVMDHLADTLGCRINRIKFKSLSCTAPIGEHTALLLKPSTYMNLSGEAVQQAMQFYKIPAERTLIIFDDISLDPGSLRIRRKGSDGGHNGMKNIIYLTGRDTFPRIKMGIGAKPDPRWDLADWVLSRFSADEQKDLEAAIENACKAVPLIVDGRIQEAMNRFNS